MPPKLRNGLELRAPSLLGAGAKLVEPTPVELTVVDGRQTCVGPEGAGRDVGAAIAEGAARPL